MSGFAGGGGGGGSSDTLNGVTVTGTPSVSGQILTATSTTGAKWSNNIVTLQPIDGTSDDSTNFYNILLANAYKNAVMLLPGPSGQNYVLNQIVGIPNGSVIIGTPGTVIKSNINETSPFLGNQAQLAPLAIPVLQANTTINFNAFVPSGATSFTTTTAGLTVGQQVQFWSSVASQPNGIYNITSVSSPVSGVYTVGIDRPMYSAMDPNRPGDTLAIVNFLPKDVYIYGNGMTVSGTGSWLFACSGAFNCHLEGCNFDTRYGTPIIGGGGVVLVDTSSFNCSVKNCHISGFTTGDGVLIAPCENILLEDIHVEDCNFNGAPIYLLTCINCNVVNCFADSCAFAGFAVDGYSYNVTFDNCIALHCNPYGFQHLGGKNTIYSNCRADFLANGATGWLLGQDVTSKPNQGILLNNCSVFGDPTVANTSGFSNGGATNVSLNNVKISGVEFGIQGGGSGYQACNLDLSNCRQGISSVSTDFHIRNLISIGGIGAFTDNFIVMNTPGITLTIDGFDITSTVANNTLVGVNVNANLIMTNGVFNMNTTGCWVISNVGACTIMLDKIIYSGTLLDHNNFVQGNAGGTYYIGDIPTPLVNAVAYNSGPLYIFSGFNGETFNSKSVSSSYNIDSGVGKDNIVLVDTVGGATTITLPSSANVTNRNITIKDKTGHAGTNHITITPSSGTIDGASSISISTNFGKTTVYCDGTNWYSLV